MPLSQADQAWSDQYDREQAAKQAQEVQPKQPPSFLQQVTAPVGRATLNTIDAAMSTAESYFNSDAGHKARDLVAGGIRGVAEDVDAARAGEKELEDKVGVHPPISLANIPQPIWDHAKQHIMDFRDAVAVQDPTMVDKGIQDAGQFLPAYSLFSRAVAGLHWAANAAIAGFGAEALSADPGQHRITQDLPRIPDIYAAGQHTQNKYIEALQQASNVPGELVNHFVNYIASTGGSDAEERFKNGIEGAITNTVATPLFHAVGVTLKHSFEGLRYAMENGVGSAGDLMPKNQVGAIGERAPLDMSMTPEQRALERERVAAARAREEGITPEPEPEPVPANAAAREGEAARRDRADQSVDAMESSPGDSVVQDLTKNDSYLTDLGMKLSAVNSGAPPVKLHDVLTEMSQKLDDGDPAGAFYKELAGRLADKNLSATITDTSPKLGNNVAWSRAGDNTHGMYHSTSDEVGLFPKAFRNNVVMAHTVTHEAVHAATLDAIKENPELKGHLDGLITAVHNLSPADKGAYGLTNAKEFVAEAESNKSFQDMLKRTKDPDNGGQTLWDQYKVILGGMLGLSGAAIASPHFDDVLTTREEKPRA